MRGKELFNTLMMGPSSYFVGPRELRPQPVNVYGVLFEVKFWDTTVLEHPDVQANDPDYYRRMIARGYSIFEYRVNLNGSPVIFGGESVGLSTELEKYPRQIVSMVLMRSHFARNYTYKSFCREMGYDAKSEWSQMFWGECQRAKSFFELSDIAGDEQNELYSKLKAELWKEAMYQ